MPKYQVSIGASKIGSQGGLYYIKRSYEIEAAPDVSRADINMLAILRAYADGDIEHVRVERVVQL